VRTNAHVSRLVRTTRTASATSEEEKRKKKNTHSPESAGGAFEFKNTGAMRMGERRQSRLAHEQF